MTMFGLVAQAEQNIAKVGAGRYRCRYHLLPPVGWKNGPNGLCSRKGT